MTWFFEKTRTQRELAGEFRQILNRGVIAKVPGAHDALAAIMAQRAGFSCVYLSGGAYSASRGWPDLGLITPGELADRARDLIRATQLPVLVDIDTGFGGPLMAARTAREMVEVGVAAVQIEDQVMPKRCGHLDGKEVVDVEEMVQKIRAIKTVAPTLVVVARTDAYAVEGIQKTLERAQQYLQAGADVIFLEALDSAEAFQEFAQQFRGPLLANMTEFGKTPYFTAKEFEDWGYAMVIYPVSSLRVAAKAYQQLYESLREQGTQRNMLQDMLTRDELYQAIQYQAYQDFDEHLAGLDASTKRGPCHRDEGRHRTTER